MGVYVDPKSPFYYMLLEGYGRKREPTGIRRDAKSPKVRKANEEAANAVYHARMVQLAKQKVGLPVDTGETFAHFVEWYRTHKAAKHKAAARTNVILDHLVAHFAATPLTDIKPARWAEYETARLKAGVSISTVGRELAVMKAVLSAAVGDHLEVNPLTHVKRSSPRLPPKRTLTKDDEARLLEQLHDDEMRDLYLLATGTLLRQVNVVTLRRRQVQGARLTVETKVGPHQLTLDGPTSLQRRCLPILERRLPKTHDGYFFPKWAARFARDRQAGNAKFLQGFRRACKRANIPWGLKAHGVVWHTATRASGATRMLREHGVDVRTVQLLGGWSSLDQMAAYLGIDLAASPQTVTKRRALTSK